MSLIHVSIHPLIRSLLANLRDVATPAAEFRRLARTITELLAYEATADLPLRDVEIQTPLTRGRFQTARRSTGHRARSSAPGWGWPRGCST